MKKLTLLLLLAMIGVSAWAVPARKGEITHRQKDGTQLTLRLEGDEHLHYYVNVATGEKMEQGADGDFRVISASNLKIRKEQADTRRAAANEARIKRLPRMRETPSGMHKAIGSFGNMSGTKKGLVILVNFQDKQFNSANNQAAFYNQFNQEGYNKNGHIGSVKDYFKAQSYGDFSIDFDVVGPVTVSQNMAYYGGNDNSGNDLRPADMIIEAVNLADSECNVDFSQYDWDGDGEVEQVFIIYAGYAEAQGADENTIWPHEWTISSAKGYKYIYSCPNKDGKYINTYACTAELSGYTGSTMDGIGTACHEFSHCLGYPDLYDTNGGDCWGMDAFDLMDYGSYSGPNGHGEVPCGYSAYERWMAGWLTPTELSEPFTVSNMPALNDSPTAYIIKNPSNSNEYLLLENRQNNNWFKYLRKVSTGHGLLVTHVDYNASSWSTNKVNIDTSHERFTYIAADKTKSSSNLPGDYFPGTGKVTSLTSSSHSSKGGAWYNGTSTFTNMDITGITESNGLISFHFNGGTSVDDGSRYTITYWVNGTKTEWTQTDFQESTTVMTIPDVFSDWIPMGWSLYDYTTNYPADQALFTDIYEDHEYTPTEDITLYAVYSDKDGNYCTSHPVEANNTITLKVNGITYGTPFTQTSETRTYTLPTVTSTVSGWTFVGWVVDEVENSTTKPTIIKAGTELRPNADVTYYAMFSSTVSAATGGPQYRLVTKPTSGNEYVIATGNTAGTAYAIDLSKIPTTSAKTMSGTEVTIADNGGLMSIAEADENLRWTLTGANNTWHVENNGTYIKINGEGFVKNTSSVDLYWSDSYGLYGKSSKGKTSYYVNSSGTQIKCDTQSGSATNRVYLYENVAGSAVTYYSTSPAVTHHTVTFEVGAAGTCGTTSFTQTEEVSSTTLPTATCSVSGWDFAGWATAAVEMTSTRPAMLTAGESYTPTVNSTLYAVYTATTYEGATATVWYCSNPTAAPTSTFFTISLSDGEANWQEPWTQTASDATFTLPALTEDGWTFFGWSSSPIGETVTTAPAVRDAGTTITPVTDMTLYSVFYRKVNDETRYISNPANYVPYGGTEDPQFVMPHAAYVGQPFHAPSIRTESTGALHFSSSNTAVAEVDEATGKVTIKGAGTAVITVTQDATATHRAATASYTIQVFDNN